MCFLWKKNNFAVVIVPSSKIISPFVCVYIKPTFMCLLWKKNNFVFVIVLSPNIVSLFVFKSPFPFQQQGASKCDSCLTDLFVLEDNGGFRCLNNSCIVGTYKSNVPKGIINTKIVINVHKWFEGKVKGLFNHDN